LKAFEYTTRRYAGYGAEGVIDVYLSRTHRDSPGQGCPADALSGEAARLPGGSRSAFAAGLESLLEGLERSVVEHDPAAPDIRARAVNILAQAVGAVMLSRACPDSSDLADEVLETCLAECHRKLASP
jgi:TetR/AcrR family transcriptional regulator, transcriptional repressor for nem operon